MSLAAALALVVIAMADQSASAEALGQPAAVTQEQALSGAVAGSPAGLRLLRDWLGQAGGKPKLTADRAIALIKALRAANIADPVALRDVLDRIARSAEEVLQRVPIFKASIGQEMTLGEGRLGFVLQSPDAAAPPGFQVILPRDPRLRGTNMKALRSPGSAPMLGAGIVGVQSVKLTVPNGRYRLIVLTSDIGVPNLDRAPFGTAVKVNNRTYEIAASAPADRRAHAVIGKGARSDATGGVLLLAADVLDGTLTVSFLNPVGETFISALILEPLAQRSLVAGVPDEAAEIAVADAAIDDAMGLLLSDFATAAGPQQTARDLGLDTPLPFAPDAISPN